MKPTIKDSEPHRHVWVWARLGNISPGHCYECECGKWSWPHDFSEQPAKERSDELCPIKGSASASDASKSVTSKTTEGSKAEDRNAAPAVQSGGSAANSVFRDFLGRLVREAWVRWAIAQPNPKASWLAPWERLSESDQEADRQIGEAIWSAANNRISSLQSENAELRERLAYISKTLDFNDGASPIEADARRIVARVRELETQVAFAAERTEQLKSDITFQKEKRKQANACVLKLESEIANLQLKISKLTSS